MKKAKVTITVDGVLKAINEIDANTHDPEKARALEDDLWREVLGAIAYAYGHLPEGEARKLAAAALRSRAIKFPRWSA